jgi:PIN domain nuclease of toxin-antitoxin system
MLIKARAGKLPLPEPAGPYIVKELAKNKIRVLPIQLDHVLRIESLPLHPRDPFDRILVSQSLVENLPLVSADPVFDSYPVNLIW